MSIDWAALGLVTAVSLAVGIGVVVLFAFGIVGLGARRQVRGGAHDGQGPTLGTTAATAVAGVCFAAVVAIVVYGIVIIAS